MKSESLRSEYRAYFGLSNKNGKISKKSFKDFIWRAYFTGANDYTLHYAHGNWKGVAEKTAIITVIAHPDDSVVIDLRNLAQYYAESFEQECVLMTCTPLLSSELIKPR